MKRLLPWAVCAGILLTGCARQPIAQSPPDVDRKLTLNSYIEDGNMVALAVGTRIAKARHDRDYMPLEIAVVNKGLPRIELTGESFTLIDEDGNRYPVVGHRELSEHYGNIDVDRRLSELRPTIAGKYQSYTPVRSTLTSSFDKPIPVRAQLTRFSYLWDMLYFPRPEGGIRGRKFELFMTAPELEDAVFVRFRVDDGKKSK